MGCKSVAKGKAATLNLTDINFKKTGIDSLDAFFANCTNILATISDIICHLFDFKIDFLKTTGFDTVPGSSLKHAFLGFILASAANLSSAADVSNLIKFKEDAPFIDIDFHRIKFDPEFFKKIYKGFVDYIQFMKDTVEKKFPEILTKVEKFPEECNNMKESAGGEIAALDFMAKGKAVMAMGLSIKSLLNVPQIFTNIFNMFKKTFMDIKDMIMEVKNSIPNLITLAEKCLTKKLKKPTECYKEAHGEIVCTPEEKAAWEKEMIKPAAVAKVDVPKGGAKKATKKKEKKEGEEGEEENEDGGDEGNDDTGNDGGDDGGDGGDGGNGGGDE